MALPLLLGPLLAGLMGAGILTGGKRYLAQRDAEGAQGLIGQAPSMMGPPDEQGGMGFNPGYGLLQGQTDPQVQFAAGIMGLPGRLNEGAGLLNQAFSRLQQGQQFEAARGDQNRQFDMTRGDQQRREATAADQFFAQFLEQQRQFGLGQANEQTRLGFARNADQRAAAAANAPPGALDLLPKLGNGWHYKQTPAGIVAAPVPGTADFERVTGKDEAFASAQGAIGQIQDIVLGKERTVNGVKVRAGGSGFEMFGGNAGTLTTLRSQVISALGKLNDMGVLQEGEFKRLNEDLPDFASNWAPGRRSKGEAAYKALGERFKGSRESLRRSNPWMDPLPTDIPPLPPGFSLLPGAR